MAKTIGAIISLGSTAAALAIGGPFGAAVGVVLALGGSALSSSARRTAKPETAETANKPGPSSVGPMGGTARVGSTRFDQVRNGKVYR